MDPMTVRWFQAAPNACVASIVAWLFGPAGALGIVLLTLVGVLFWFGLIARYLRRRSEVSEHRLEGDRVMLENVPLAFAGPLASGVVAFAVGLHPIVEPSSAAWTISLPLLAILSSSVVDWYVVLPFRDGIEGLPACRVEEVPVALRRRITKLWVAHRLVCELAITAALLATAFLVASHYTEDLSAVMGAVSFLGGVGVAVGLAWKRWVMGGLRFTLRQGPAVGNWTVGDSDRGRRSGFVRDVSLDNGVKVVAAPTAAEHFIPLVFAVPDGSLPRRDYACDGMGCKEWLRNGDDVMCDVYWRALEAEQRRVQAREDAGEAGQSAAAS